MKKIISPFSLENKTAAIIGAGAGIGKAVAVACSSQGASVTCLDINLQMAQKTAQEIQSAGGRAEAATLDVRDFKAVQTALEASRGSDGRLDIVISTPAINFRKTLAAYAEEEFYQVIDLNLKGGLHVLQAAGAIMAAQGGGSILLFSLIRGQVVEPGQGVYAATKAGIVQMVRTAAAELGASGVRVNAIAPGVVDTPLTQEIKKNKDWHDAYAAKCVFKRWARPEEIAAPAVFLSSEAASYITATVLYVDGGWTAVDGRFDPPGMT